MTVSSRPNLGAVPLEPDVAKTLRRLAGRAQEAMQKRDALIMEARRAGASLREIEAATGINYVTVKRLIEKYETAGEAQARVEADLRKNAIKRQIEADHRARRQEGRD